MSWKEINEEPKQENPNQNEFNEFCNLCYQVFEISISGKKLFEILDKQLKLPVCPPDKAATYGYHREGRNSLIREFQNAISYQKERMRKDNG